RWQWNNTPFPRRPVASPRAGMQRTDRQSALLVLLALRKTLSESRRRGRDVCFRTGLGGHRCVIARPGEEIAAAIFQASAVPHCSQNRLSGTTPAPQPEQNSSCGKAICRADTSADATGERATAAAGCVIGARAGIPDGTVRTSETLWVTGNAAAT